MRTCSICGTTYPDNENSCPLCGNPANDLPPLPDVSGEAPAPPPVPTPPQRRSSSMLIVLLVIIGLMLMAGVGVFLFGGKNSGDPSEYNEDAYYWADSAASDTSYYDSATVPAPEFDSTDYAPAVETPPAVEEKPKKKQPAKPAMQAEPANDEPARRVKHDEPERSAPRRSSNEAVDNVIVDVPATYPGGEAALLKFISENLIYPAVAQENGVQGTVIVRFMVDTDGSVGHVVVRKSLSKECDQAAVNVVRKLHRFTPARLEGRPIPVWFTIPIRFRMM